MAAIILYSRYPEPGQTKTRLIPALGADGAAGLQRRMTERAARAVLAAGDATGCRVEVHFDGGDPERMRDWLGTGFSYRRQAAGDIGRRMRCSLAALLALGEEGAVLVGSDCPGLNAALLGEALCLLAGTDVVFGPALDGGYYLVGVSGRVPEEAWAPVFAGMPWGEPTLLQATLAKTARLGLCAALLPALTDIDRPDDLAHLRHHPGL